MSWQPKDGEIAAMLSASGEKRFEYFIKRVADTLVLFSLAKEKGWGLANNNDGVEVVPVWPHQCYAEKCAVGEWSGYQPKPIPVDVWISRWTPGIEKDRRLVGVFPTSADKGVIVEAKTLARCIQEELTRY